MSDPVIRVEGLGKRYRLQRRDEERYVALRDVIVDQAARLLGRAGPPPVHDEAFWALRAVTFDVARGETLGIIGRNGAGKSTLLKILSRITEPTEGRVRLRGRVASLLEVGTGFHPELSGRENIYLNGAILGMSREEVRRKFDEIVAFAEIERFIDTPVKRYSSGMYVRLAFAVAAHLEPDILIVDEVLAVGDAGFQKRCLGKLREVSSSSGRTVLFVSHNLGAVRSLCGRALFLERGEIRFQGAVDEALAAYARLTSRAGGARPRRAPPDDRPCIVSVEVDEQKASAGTLHLAVAFRSPRVLDPVLVGAVFYNELGVPVFGFNTWQDQRHAPRALQSGVARLDIPTPPLHSGTYRVGVFLGEQAMNFDVLEDAATFTFVAPEALPMGISTHHVGSTRVAGSWVISES